MRCCDKTVCRHPKHVGVNPLVQNHRVFHQDGFDCFDAISSLGGSFKLKVRRRIVHGGREVLDDAFVVPRHEAREGQRQRLVIGLGHSTDAGCCALPDVSQ